MTEILPEIRAVAMAPFANLIRAMGNAGSSIETIATAVEEIEVAKLRPPMSGAERARRYRARKKEKRLAGA